MPLQPRLTEANIHIGYTFSPLSRGYASAAMIKRFPVHGANPLSVPSVGAMPLQLVTARWWVVPLWTFSPLSRGYASAALLNRCTLLRPSSLSVPSVGAMPLQLLCNIQVGHCAR